MTAVTVTDVVNRLMEGTLVTGEMLEQAWGDGVPEDVRVLVEELAEAQRQVMEQGDGVLLWSADVTDFRDRAKSYIRWTLQFDGSDETVNTFLDAICARLQIQMELAACGGPVRPFMDRLMAEELDEALTGARSEVMKDLVAESVRQAAWCVYRAEVPSVLRRLEKERFCWRSEEGGADSELMSLYGRVKRAQANLEAYCAAARLQIGRYMALPKVKADGRTEDIMDVLRYLERYSTSMLDASKAQPRDTPAVCLGRVYRAYMIAQKLLMTDDSRTSVLHELQLDEAAWRNHQLPPVLWDEAVIEAGRTLQEFTEYVNGLVEAAARDRVKEKRA